MQHLEVSGAVRHIYIYVIRRLKVKGLTYPVTKVLAIVIMARKLTRQLATSACKIYRSYGTVVWIMLELSCDVRTSCCQVLMKRVHLPVLCNFRNNCRELHNAFWPALNASGTHCCWSVRVFFKHLLWLRHTFIDDWWQYALREMYVYMSVLSQSSSVLRNLTSR